MVRPRRYRRSCARDVSPSPRVGIVRSPLHVGWQKRGPLSGVRRAAVTFVNVGTWRASVNENVLTFRTLRAENLACACGVVSAIGGRRERRAHLARRPNENPAVAQRCGVIIVNNLPAGTRAECEKSENKRGKERKRGMGIPGAREGLIYLGRGCQPHSKSPDWISRRRGGIHLSRSRAVFRGERG